MTLLVATDQATSDADAYGSSAMAKRLFESDAAFVPNSFFEDEAAEREILDGERSESQPGAKDHSPLSSLPAHLARMCETRLLAAAEETDLFRRMNYLKYRFNLIRDRLDPARPDQGQLAQAEELLEWSKRVRNRIVRSNMRLVISIARKFVSPQHSFDDMLSEGIWSLMKAVEKFDYHRGFRFSTYAYRAIARNALRMVQDHQRDNSRCTSGPVDEMLAENEVTDAAAQERAWSRWRQLLSQIMQRLDARERMIVAARYALADDTKVRTFQSLADELGVSKERVRQLEQRAMGKLRKAAQELGADDLWEASVSHR